MKYKYYQYYKYIPILQIIKTSSYLKFDIGSIGNSRPRRAGFTMVELLLYMGLLSIFIFVITDILVSIFSTQLTTRSNSQVTQDGRYIYSRLIYDINRADSVTTPANLGDTNNELVLDIDGTDYTYSLFGDAMTISDATNTDILNNPDTAISDLEFSRIGNADGKHTFQIIFTVTGKIPLNGRIDSQNFQTTAGLR